MSLLRKAAKGFFEGAGEFQKEVLKDQMANRGWMRRQKYLEGVEAAKYARNRAGQLETTLASEDRKQIRDIPTTAASLARNYLTTNSIRYKSDMHGQLLTNDRSVMGSLIAGFMRGDYTGGRGMPADTAGQFSSAIWSQLMSRSGDGVNPAPVSMPSVSEVRALVSDAPATSKPDVQPPTEYGEVINSDPLAPPIRQSRNSG
jgi:hypothetical protein